MLLREFYRPLSKAPLFDLCMSQLCTKPARVPFESLGEWEALFQIVTGSRPARPIGEDAAGDGLITDALWDMVESCWDQDPAKRPSISDVLAQLSQL
jgi:hypothetical protein